MCCVVPAMALVVKSSRSGVCSCLSRQPRLTPGMKPPSRCKLVTSVPSHCQCILPTDDGSAGSLATVSQICPSHPQTANVPHLSPKHHLALCQASTSQPVPLPQLTHCPVRTSYCNRRFHIPSCPVANDQPHGCDAQQPPSTPHKCVSRHSSVAKPELLSM